MRRDRSEQLRKMEHFSDPENEDPMDSLRKLRFFLEYLVTRFKENYIPAVHLAIDEHLSLWKGRLSFRIYIPTKRERYGVKIFMLCESKTGYLLNFIIYTGATTEYPLPMKLISPNTGKYGPEKLLIWALFKQCVSHCTIIATPQN